MPATASGMSMAHKIQLQRRDRPDDYLPSAATCFFSLSLPEYSSKEVLRKKLVMAISSTPNMDADVRQHTAEGWDE